MAMSRCWQASEVDFSEFADRFGNLIYLVLNAYGSTRRGCNRNVINELTKE
jgi:hypothetical protein